MADKTKTFKVRFIGDEKALSRTFRSTSKDATSFGKRCSIAGKSLRSLVRGDFKSAATGLRSLGSGFGTLAKGATVAFASIVSGAGVALYTIKRWTSEYVTWGKEQGKLTRLTGIQGQAVAKLTTQWRLSGVTTEKGTKATALFSKYAYAQYQKVTAATKAISGLDKTSKTYTDDLAAANLDLKDAQGAFGELGVKLTDSNGKMRSTSDILSDVRSEFSQMEPGAKRTALAMKIFGKSGADMLPWLTKTSTEIEHYNALLKKSGLSWGKDAQANLAAYIAKQREMSFMWDVLKYRVSQRVVPWVVDHWSTIENGFERVRKAVDGAFTWLYDHSADIAKGVRSIGNAARFVGRHWKALAFGAVALKMASAAGSAVRLASGLRKASGAFSILGGTGFFQAGKWTAVASGAGSLATKLGLVGAALGTIASVAAGAWLALKYIVDLKGELEQDPGATGSGYGENEYTQQWKAITYILPAATDAWEQFRSSVKSGSTDLTASSKKLASFKDQFVGLRKSATQIGDKDAVAKINRIIKQIDNLGGKNAKPKVRVDSDADKKSKAAASKLSALNNTTARPKVRVDTANALSDAEALRQKLVAKFAKTIYQQIKSTVTGGVGGVIDNAKGGDYIVTKPTYFRAGEAGPERATFTPLNSGTSSSRSGVSSAAAAAVQAVKNVVIPIYLDGQEIASYVVDMTDESATLRSMA